jgi:hypothetical protein
MQDERGPQQFVPVRRASMKRRPTQLICTLIALIAPVGAFASGAEQPFSVSLKAPDKPLKAGAELVLRATIKNTSDHDMAFPTSPGLIPSDGFRYQIEIRDKDGRPAPPSARVLELRKLQEEAGKEGKPVLPGPPTSNTSRPLKPGESFVDEINVSDYFRLDRPGVYTIWVIRPLPPYLTGNTPKKFWKGSVRSNTITVTVVK